MSVTNCDLRGHLKHPPADEVRFRVVRPRRLESLGNTRPSPAHHDGAAVDGRVETAETIFPSLGDRSQWHWRREMVPTSDQLDSIGAVCAAAVGMLSVHRACHSFLRCQTPSPYLRNSHRRG